MTQLTRLGNFFSFLITVLFIGVLFVSLGVFYVVYHYSRDLPDYSQLSEYAPATVTRFYAGDGKLLAEYAKEKRIFVPIDAIPKKVVNAFIAAEDKNFYSHPGIDIMGIIRAAARNVTNTGQLSGGSTITQQVVKNFLLTNEKSFSRKIKEAILSFRITQTFSKEKILELYLNEIYLGNRSYGVAAAALNYFNKSLAELTIEEAAMLAALPKAPSSLDPARHPEKAKERRDWVIKRMEEEGFIDEVESVIAAAKPIVLADRTADEIVKDGDYFAEAVRKQIEGIYGEKTLYEDGLAVKTTVNPDLQKYAAKALVEGLVEYDRRHGWRGPIGKIETGDKWLDNIKNAKSPSALGEWLLAVVLDTTANSAKIGLKDGTTGSIPLEEMKWARKYFNEDSMGGSVTKVTDVIKEGDLIAVTRKEADKKIYSLQQIPEANGAIVAMDPYSGRVLAMSGGFHFAEDSQFNRAIQAKRQPGSAFKPFVYVAALENGFAPNSIIVDEEIQLDQGPGLPEWRPQNYSGEFYGPTTLRTGVEKSRNAMTVRLSQLIGIEKIIDITQRFGIAENPERNFSMVLGSSETTLMKLTNAYAMLVNGGKKVKPSMVERIQDRNGQTIYKRDTRQCPGCLVTSVEDNDIAPLIPPALVDEREQVTDPISAYQMVSILEGVIQRGTGTRAKSLERTVAGKTGTTNNSNDTWFIGFSSDLVVGVFVGFDTPRSLGNHETGASAALPIWIDFMGEAMKGRPDIPFRRPSGVKLVKIDYDTGQPPSPGTAAGHVIYEAFRPGTEPGAAPQETTPEEPGDSTAPAPNSFGTEGVY